MYKHQLTDTVWQNVIRCIGPFARASACRIDTGWVRVDLHTERFSESC